MASLPILCLLGIFTLTTESEAQLANVTLQVNNVTDVESTVNLTTPKPELPPGGLQEVIVNVAESTNSTTLAPVTVLPRLKVDDFQIKVRRIKDGKEEHKEDHEKVLLVNPDNIPTKVLGSRCMGPKDCLSINNTGCINGICDCISGFIPSKHSLEKCIKVPVGLDDDCEEEAQCAHVVAASECRGGKCSCPPNFVFDVGRCWERRLLGGICNTSKQCDNVPLSLCAQGVCACQPPLIPSPNSNKCLQVAGTVYQAPCEEDIQCTDSYGDEAHCSNSQCICTNDYHFNDTICVPDKKLGDVCLSDTDCSVSDIKGSRVCISEVCSCANGFITLPGEDICTQKSSGEELAVSFTWIVCIFIAKYYLS